MKKIILAVIILVSCNQNKRFEVINTKCVIDSIYEVPRSTIEINKKYSLVTDCGEYTLSTNNLKIKKGDTILFPSIVKIKK